MSQHRGVPVSVTLYKTDRQPGLLVLHSHHNETHQAIQPYSKLPYFYIWGILGFVIGIIVESM